MTEEQREPLLPSTSSSKATNLRNSIRGFLQGTSTAEHATFMSILNSNIKGVTMEYVYFPLEIAKIVKECGNGIEIDELQDANVSFLLDFHTIEEKMNAKSIVISVFNTTSPKPVNVPNVTLSHIQETKIKVEVNLNSVAGEYRVRKRMSDNQYQLHVDIFSADGSKVQLPTRTFQLIKGSNAAPILGMKRKQQSFNYNPPISSYEQMNDARIEVENDGLVKSQQIVCDYIKTQLLTLDGESIRIGKAITTSNGDVAYHFLLENSDERFEEGEVVGLVPSTQTNSEGKSESTHVITKLTFASSSQALIKGVVTRSQYLEVMKPPNGIRSETVAMMGVVPVQVRGRIYANEPLYSSPKYPGFAVSATELDHTQLNEAAFVGYAFTSRQTADADSTGMVQAAVSILQNCGKKLLSERLNHLKQQLDVKIEKVDRFGKRTRKCMCVSMLMSTLLVILVGALIWQLVTPGSALRYYQCQRSRKVPDSEATFSMRPLGHPHRIAVVNGIEFEFEELLVKAGHEEYPKLEFSGAKYYLNIDRCAYGHLSYGDIPSGTKPVLGPTIFAVDRRCFQAYYFDESSFSWKMYNSASWLKFKNICCTPESLWKSCNELKASKLCSARTSCL